MMARNEDPLNLRINCIMFYEKGLIPKQLVEGVLFIEVACFLIVHEFWFRLMV